MRRSIIPQEPGSAQNLVLRQGRENTSQYWFRLYCSASECYNLYIKTANECPRNDKKYYLLHALLQLMIREKFEMERQSPMTDYHLHFMSLKHALDMNDAAFNEVKESI